MHLDFHTSEAIDKIGSKFSKKQFQKMLELGHVNSITVFSKCHHGWAYHPSEANEIHPKLGYDLLGDMIEAAHEIGVKTPVYFSAGFDEKMARRHPEWLIRDINERTLWETNFMQPGYHLFCFNSPYLEYLIKQVDNIRTSIRMPFKVKRVYLAPQMEEIEFEQKDNVINYIIPRVCCHQMVVLDY